jgi:hypothetical protein
MKIIIRDIFLFKDILEPDPLKKPNKLKYGIIIHLSVKNKECTCRNVRRPFQLKKPPPFNLWVQYTHFMFNSEIALLTYFRSNYLAGRGLCIPCNTFISDVTLWNGKLKTEQYLWKLKSFKIGFRYLVNLLRTCRSMKESLIKKSEELASVNG